GSATRRAPGASGVIGRGNVEGRADTSEAAPGSHVVRAPPVSWRCLQPPVPEVPRDGEAEGAGADVRGGETDAERGGVVGVEEAEEPAPARALDGDGPVVDAAEAVEDAVGEDERGGDADVGALPGAAGVARAVAPLGEGVGRVEDP